MMKNRFTQSILAFSVLLVSFLVMASTNGPAPIVSASEVSNPTIFGRWEYKTKNNYNLTSIMDIHPNYVDQTLICMSPANFTTETHLRVDARIKQNTIWMGPGQARTTAVDGTFCELDMRSGSEGSFVVDAQGLHFLDLNGAPQLDSTGREVIWKRPKL
jgi:hypothetical protein